MEININKNNLNYNFELIRKITGYGKNVMPVLKADAYNIGVENIVEPLLKLKTPQKNYCVFSLNEGINLRVKFPELDKIFVLSGIAKDEGKYFEKYKLIPVACSYQQLKICKKENISKIGIKFNTGMNRSGIELKNLNKVRKFVDDNRIKVLMVMSHFCCADNPESEVNEIQILNFEKIIKYFPEKSIIRSFQASDAIVNFDLGYLCNACRPGLVLYGYYKGFKPVYSIYSKICFDGKNFYMPFGIKNGITSDYKNGYVFVDGKKIKVISILDDRVILDIQDKKYIDKKAELLGENISMQEFEKMTGTDIRDIVARLFTNIHKKDKNITEFKKATATIKNGEFINFYSTIIEKRVVAKDGIVGYGATEKVKNGDKLAVFFGGYLDGLSRSISNKKCYVFVEKKDKTFAKCEIFGKISMDQTIIKINEKDYKDIKIGAKVIIFDKEHPIEQFEKATGKGRAELFFYLDKTNRILIK